MNIYEEFLNNYDYDVRKSGDARWIDQKCTYDVLCIIADCINEYVQNDESKEFTVSDIWHSEYARENVISIFSKPDPELKAENEYDKYFSQPIKLLSYSRILNVRKANNKNYYSIKNKELLEKISLRPMNALEFLCCYIRKVLTDSGLINVFDEFFNAQTKEAYNNVREKFIEFTIKYTKINGKTECGRIFSKILNPIAFKLKKLGTEKGRISKVSITLNDLQYNRFNWRDSYDGKEKMITRNEFELQKVDVQIDVWTSYDINKAKNIVRKFNDMFNNGESEISQDTEYVKATQAHHIFPQSEFSTIAHYPENLIMLTPNQHYAMAHPENKTLYVDKDFQYICLLAKTKTIYDHLTSDVTKIPYTFKDFKYVLNTGLRTEEFSDVSDLDFATILHKIDYFYSDVISNNKYKDLIPSNKIKF